MTKQEIAQLIQRLLKQDQSVILIGCHGLGKWKLIHEEISKNMVIPSKNYLDASQWSSDDFFKNIRENGKKYIHSILCIPNIFELKDAFSIINLLFDNRILFLGTSDYLVPDNDSDYSSISNRFTTISIGSPDYRDWQRENKDRPYSSFCLHDYPNYLGDKTLLEIITRGLKHGTKFEEQSKKLLSFMKYILRNGEKPFSYRSLGQELGYSTNTVHDYVTKLEQMNLLYSIIRTNLRDGKNAGSKFLFYPTFNSFYPFSPEDLMERNNILTIYISKLISKLQSYNYRVFSGYLYSTEKGIENRYRECGLVLNSGEKRIYMQIDFEYNEDKAKSLLSIRDNNPKYFAVLSNQELQILDNGLRLIGIDQLIKGEIRGLYDGNKDF